MWDHTGGRSLPTKQCTLPRTPAPSKEPGGGSPHRQPLHLIQEGPVFRGVTVLCPFYFALKLAEGKRSATAVVSERAWRGPG